MHQRIYNELVMVERAALRRGPRTRDGLMLRGLGDVSDPSTMTAADSQSLIAQAQAQLAQQQASRAQTQADLNAALSTPQFRIWAALSTASAAACAYHGYRRHRGSIGWAIGWGMLGGIFFPITPAIALAEGFGKPAKK